jgi:hypothetical protein
MSTYSALLQSSSIPLPCSRPGGDDIDQTPKNGTTKISTPQHLRKADMSRRENIAENGDEHPDATDPNQQ